MPRRKAKTAVQPLSFPGSSQLEEEALKNVRTESLSTFKSSPAVPCNKQHPPLPPVKMAQSYHGDMSSGDKKFATNTKSIMSSSAVGLNSSQVTNHSVKSKVQSLAEGVQKQLNGESTLKPKKRNAILAYLLKVMSSPN